METEVKPPGTGQSLEAGPALRELADSPPFATMREDLLDLASRVDGDPLDFDGWDRVDLQAAFPTSGINVPHRRGREVLIGALAGAAMFFPLIWTWWSLRLATTAYDSMIADGTADDQSFLQLWVTGFDGQLSDAHTLPSVTRISVLLIALAILLFVAHRIMTAKDQDAEEAALTAAEVRLHSALLHAQRRMAGKIVSNGESFESLVIRSLDELEKAQRATREAADQLKATVGDLERTVAGVEAAVTTSSEHVQQSATAVDTMATSLGGAAATVLAAAEESHASTRASLDTMAATLASASSRFGQDMDAAATRYVAEISEQLRDDKRELTDVRSAVARMQEELLAALNQFSRTEEAAASRVDALATALAQVQDRGTSEITGSVDGVNAAVSALAEHVNAMLSKLADSTGRLDDAIVSSSTAVQSQVREMQAVRDALEMIARDNIGSGRL